MSRPIYILSYENPDLDGVASSVALASLLTFTERLHCTPLVFGGYDDETKFISKLTQLALPQVIQECPSDGFVYLVDTHHVAQLKGKVPLHRVIGIYDHHPGGDIHAFPNARIVNEPIGAVATLIAERYQEAGLKPLPPVALLLHAAIISNTINFAAPTTTQRDHDAAQWLSKYVEVPHDLAQRMFEARSQCIDHTTSEIVTAHAKTFDCASVKIAISQVEGVGLASLLTRDDLVGAVRSLKASERVRHAFLSIVDQANQTTTLYAPDEDTQEMLQTAVGVVFNGAISIVNRILLRKSDLVPPLIAYFKTQRSEAPHGS